MLWYGLSFYFSTFFFLFGLIVFFYKIFLIKDLNWFKFYNIASLYVLNFFLILSFIVIMYVYMIYEYYFTYTILTTNFNTDMYNKLIYYTPSVFIALSYHYSYIYIFPFVYIFIIVTMLSILFCLSYNYNEVILFMFYCSIILFSGFFLFNTDSIILFFFYYELLLIPSFFILYKFAKTRRCIEAAYLMFFWTQFGALFLIFSFIYMFYISGSSSFYNISLFNFSNFEVNFFFICWIIGFGVKLPIWPFYGWLPKAHVEASTNFSIFLSGVLVKFAFFGLLKCLLLIQLEPTFSFVYPFLFIGIIDAVFKLFYQIDLKKLVAYATVVEMHWLTICIVSGQSALILASFCMLISHAFLSTNSFLLVDSINRKFKTRLITEISGVNFMCPKLFLVSLANLLIFLGFPGTIFFISEFLFFSFFFDLFPIMAIILMFLLYFFAPTFFFRSWMNVLFGLTVNINKTIPLDLSSKELTLYASLLLLMFWLGISWQAFIF